ncbi:MAG: type II toxin-antitoxin system RelE/ParE family toxin [Candidatus Binatia bacterium]
MAEDSPQAATAFVAKIQDKFQPLLQQPEMGPSRDFLAPGLRVHFYGQYAIYYQATEMELIIIRVVHGARDRSALFAQKDSEG